MAGFPRKLGLKLPVLRYNRGGPRRKDGFDKAQSLWVDFERQVRWLKRCGYVGICPWQWLAWVRDGRRLQARPVLITFDHADTEVGDHALPILHRHGFGAGVFVAGAATGAPKLRRWVTTWQAAD